MKRKRLYFSDEFFAKYETNARHNIQREIQQLAFF